MKQRDIGLMLCALTLSATAIAVEKPASGLMLTPDQVEWKPNPRVPGLGVAKVLGDATKPGPYVQRVKFPPGRVVQAHSHPDDRTYTVISGTWYVGWGDKYDPANLKAMPPGSFYTEPAGVPHFIATPDGEAIVQITGTGVTAVHYVDPAHALKKQGAARGPRRRPRTDGLPPAGRRATRRHPWPFGNACSPSLRRRSCENSPWSAEGQPDRSTFAS